MANEAMANVDLTGFNLKINTELDLMGKLIQRNDMADKSGEQEREWSSK